LFFVNQGATMTHFVVAENPAR
jgi:hypothetical protein